jgi:hypothetical protein
MLLRGEVYEQLSPPITSVTDNRSNAISNGYYDRDEPSVTDNRKDRSDAISNGYHDRDKPSVTDNSCHAINNDFVALNNTYQDNKFSIDDNVLKDLEALDYDDTIKKDNIGHNEGTSLIISINKPKKISTTHSNSPPKYDTSPSYIPSSKPHSSTPPHKNLPKFLTETTEISTPKSNRKKFIGSNKKLKQNDLTLNYEDIKRTKTASIIYKEVMNYDIDNKGIFYDNEIDSTYDSNKKNNHNNNNNNNNINSNKNNDINDYDNDNDDNNKKNNFKDMDSQQQRVRDWLDWERKFSELGESSHPLEVHSPTSKISVSTGTSSERTPLQKDIDNKINQIQLSRMIISTTSSLTPTSKVVRGAWTEERRALSDRAIMAALMRAQVRFRIIFYCYNVGHTFMLD